MKKKNKIKLNGNTKSDYYHFSAFLAHDYQKSQEGVQMVDSQAMQLMVQIYHATLRETRDQTLSTLAEVQVWSY